MRPGRRSLGLDYAALHARYEAGESSTEIAASVGIDPGGLRRAWQRRGLPLRGGSEAKHAMYRRHPGSASVAAAHAAARNRIQSFEERCARAATRERLQRGTSAIEDRLAQRLTEAGVPFRRQAAIGPYNVDFAFDAQRLALDIDGGGHNPHIRANRPARTAYIEAEGWRVVTLRTRGDWMERAVHEALPK